MAGETGPTAVRQGEATAGRRPYSARRRHRHCDGPAGTAIHRPQPKIARIDEAVCIGRLRCVEVWPGRRRRRGAPLLHTVIEADCTAATCIPACPVDCISLNPPGPEAMPPTAPGSTRLQPHDRDGRSRRLQPAPAPALGLRLPARKSLSTGEPILVAPPPAEVCISLYQRNSPPAKPRVRSGQRVRRGEPVADPAARAARGYASIAGEVVDVAERPVRAAHAGTVHRHPRRRQRRGADGYRPGPMPPACRPRRCAPSSRKGILLGGAQFPAVRKLDRWCSMTLLLNGAECEPYISCDDMLLREAPNSSSPDARILLDAIGGERCVIALKNDIPEARIAVWSALEAAGDPRLTLSIVTARYPSGGERQLIEMVLGREVPSGGLPVDAGCLCHNVATAAAVAEFFAEGRPMISRIVTLTGGGVASPRNIDARIGTPIAALVELAGGYRDEPGRLIMGGPMMGVALPDDALPVTAATNCVIAATAGELGAFAVELPCIRCGLCIEVCPARLLPQELLVAGRRTDEGALDELGVDDCIECRACDYVCPSHIPLAGHFIASKALLAERRRAKAHADTARARYEAREERLAAEAAQRGQELAEQLPGGSGEADPGASRDALAALLERTRKKSGDPS